MDEEKNEQFGIFPKARDLAKDTNDIIATESELAGKVTAGKYKEAYEHLQTAVSLGRTIFGLILN